jgi:hypothetical protein
VTAAKRETFSATCPQCGRTRSARTDVAGRVAVCSCGAKFTLVPNFENVPKVSASAKLKGASDKAWISISKGSVELGHALAAMSVKSKFLTILSVLVVFSTLSSVFSDRLEFAEQEDVLRLTREGLSAVEVAREMEIPEETVRKILKQYELDWQDLKEASIRHRDPPVESSFRSSGVSDAKISTDIDRHVIGSWFDGAIGMRITIVSQNGNIYGEESFSDGSSNKMELTERSSSLGRRFDKGGGFGDHWIVTAGGSLQLRDSQGLITTLR